MTSDTMKQFDGKADEKPINRLRTPVRPSSSAYSADSFPRPAISSISACLTNRSGAFKRRCGGLIETRLNQLRQDLNI